MRIRTELAASMLVLLLAVTTVVGVAGYVRTAEVLHAGALEAAEAALAVNASHVEDRLASAATDTLILSTLPVVAGQVRARDAGGRDPESGNDLPAWRRLCEAAFARVAGIEPSYLQIRYIDETGHEQVRVDVRDGQAVVAPRSALQDKSREPYYRAATGLPVGAVHLSPMNLNREHGRIAVPHVPVIRLATPIRNARDEPRGIVVVNLAGDELTHHLRAPLGSLAMVNREGDYLHHPDASREFGTELGHPHRLAEDHPHLARVSRSGDRTVIALASHEAGRAAHVHALRWVRLERFSGESALGLVWEAPDSVALAAVHAQRQTFVWLGLAGALVAGLLAWVWAARFARPVAALFDSARRLAGGDLGVRVETRGNAEIVGLAEAFNSMAAGLRASHDNERAGRERLEHNLGAIAEAASRLASGSAQILAAASQQASGASEQAAAVAQTVATVEQVTQTASQAAERARAVAQGAVKAAESGKVGTQAVDDSVAGMSDVREKVEAVAESIVALAEQAQAIGETIAVVDEIAEQTNMLALNAAIEASRAGEHGRGFSVVATEVRALADQAKRATALIRQILGEIQGATEQAVDTTEAGTRSVAATLRIIEQARETIRSLADTVTEAAQAAAQISASTGQQAAGMAQIHHAMRNISQITHQTLSATRQSERAAHDLDALASRLRELLSRREG